MHRFLSAAGLSLVMLSGVTAEGPAWADSTPRQSRECGQTQMGDPGSVLRRMSRDQIVRAYEVIVEGMIESYAPPTGRHSGAVVMRIDKAWKGNVTPRVTWLTYPTLPSTEWPSPDQPDCLLHVQVGQHVRIGSSIVGKAGGVPNINGVDTSTDVLDSHFFIGLVFLPLSDPELNDLLNAYRAKTEALQQAATTSGQAAKIAFATHLLDNNERHRAAEIADALRSDGVNLAPIGVLLLTGDRKDWSDLKRLQSPCYSDHGDLDNAVLDRSDLSA